MATSRAAFPRLGPSRFQLSFVITLTSIILALCGASSAQNLTVLHSFSGYQGDGYQPFAPVVVDQNGVLYGTTAFGGNLRAPGCVVGCGEVFQMTPPAQSGGTWNYTPIHKFTGDQIGAAGAMYSALTLDSDGRLYGVGNGLFRLSPPSQAGGAWSYKNIYSFTNGLVPSTPLLTDAAGSLYAASSPSYGTTGFGAVCSSLPRSKGNGQKTFSTSLREEPMRRSRRSRYGQQHRRALRSGQRWRRSYIELPPRMRHRFQACAHYDRIVDLHGALQLHRCARR